MVDTNILLRSIQPLHPFYERATSAVEKLLNEGETVHFCAQNVRELWNVCTRPIVNNGLGMSPAEVVREVTELESMLTFLPESAATYFEWRRLVETHGVIGTQVHDTNLIAAMRVAGISQLLTLNPAHFRRFTEITVLEP